MPKYEVNNSKLYIDGKNTFDPEIFRIFPVDNVGVLVIVNSSSPTDQKTPRNNAFLLDESGKVVWQIESLLDGLKRPSGYYTNFWFAENGDLMVHNVRGYTIKVDIKTGKLLDITFTK